MTALGLHEGLLLHDVLLPRERADDHGHLAAPAEDLGTHRDRLGPCPPGGEAALAALDGLTGRGGAHFPTARKWRAAQGTAHTVVANGAESEPLSGKDTVLLRQRPHLVLDGLVLAAQTVGAARAVLWLHDDARDLREPVEMALAQRRVAGLPRVEVVLGPDRYLSGESSAIGRALTGGPALPAFRLGRGPVLVNNVETLARAALLARGQDLPRTLLTVLSSSFRHVLDVPSTRPLDAVLADTGWTHGRPEAVLLGGFGGAWHHWADVADREVGELHRELGSGIVAALPPGACGITETAAVLRYLAGSSARQCGPCFRGLPAMATAAERLAVGGRRSDLRQLEQDAATVAGRGACSHPDGAVRLVTSAADVFAADLDRHRRGRACPGAAHAFVPVPR